MSRLASLAGLRVVAVLLASLGCLIAMCAPSGAGAGTACEGSPPDSALSGFSASNRPVVLVHGWDGKAANLEGVGRALKSAHLPLQLLYFDYSTHNTDWASRPTVAGCLATYIAAVSGGYKRAGGDGKLVVVAHSMGGLAVRFASSSRYVSNPIAGDLAGVITIDTPSLGSPFGNQSLARALQALPIVGGGHISSLFNGSLLNGFGTPSGTDASICLAAHEPPANRLPHGCDLAPYLPSGVPITQLAGDINVRRSLLGIELYPVDLGTDGPVPVQSAHGYINSGPGGRAPRGSDAREQPTVACTVKTDDVEAAAAGAGIGGVGGALGAVTNTIFIDNSALSELQSGNTGKALDAFLLAAYIAAPCSHSGMLTDPTSLADVVSAVRADLEQLGASGTTTLIDTSPVDGNSAPRSGITIIDKGAASSCSPGSDSVGDAYRCFSGNGVYDPCWADQTRPSTTAVICQRAPWDTTVTRLTLAQALAPFPGPPMPIDRNAPWGVQLTTGERCLAAQGAHDNFNGRVVDYTCGSSYDHVLLRGIHWDGQRATFDSAYYSSGANTYRRGPTVTVATAWYAIPDTPRATTSGGGASVPQNAFKPGDLNTRDASASKCDRFMEIGPRARCDVATVVEQDLAAGKWSGSGPDTVTQGGQSVTFNCPQIGTEPGGAAAPIYRCVSVGDSEDWFVFSFT
jgi:pimeloyl-ACP methyl ester carboxylesterase